MEIQFTDIDVKRAMVGQYRISATMQLVDVAEILFSYPFGCDYKPGDNVAYRIDALKKELQDALDNYAAEQKLKNNAALGNKLDELKSELIIPQL